ncbi:GNAT family N-acetyltransferase [Nocardioides solisilvae]|uniref:GNAT family N-acetyltransferase n=1 Tax=Nocardioides solisilvae TaxID=1542435 RepID=UPI00194EBCB6|nr:GNAT family N-acetyltransferase [Nocardioides solisilvae]
MTTDTSPSDDGSRQVRVRVARAEDGPRLRAIDLATWDPAVTPMPRKSPEEPFFSDRLDPADALVATRAGVPCGFALLQQHLSEPSRAHVLLLNGLAVDPAHQGHGAGRLLLDATLAAARARGLRKVGLRVLSTNPTARRLYESAGFVVEGVLRGEFVLEGREVDDVLMARRLDPGPPA